MLSCGSEDASWPALPGAGCSNKVANPVKKFSHVVKKESNRILKVDGEKPKSHEMEKSSNIEQVTPEKIIENFVKESYEKLKQENKNDLIRKISEASEEKGPVNEGTDSRNHRKKQLLKEDKKRAKEEEIRRNLVAPKGQKVQIVDRKKLEVLLNNNVSFVNRQAVIPTLTETDFPSMEDAKKQRVKSKGFGNQQQSIEERVIKRIKKCKDPVYVDLVNLIKKKPKRLPNSKCRVQKKEKTANLYSGNQLDSSNPERKRGKVREVPKKKKPSALKSAILEERALRRRLKAITSTVENLSIENNVEPAQPSIHSRKFREYCENRLTPRLNSAMKLLLKHIVRFQDRQYQKNPIKAFSKRRYVLGFREVKKQLGLKKIKLLVIAPDMEIAKNEGGIDETVDNLKALAKEQNVTCVYALSRRELGFITYKKVGISCLGICNYEGTERTYEEVLAALAEAKESYQKEISSNVENVPDVTNEVITSLLSKLSHDESPFLNAIEHGSKSEEKREKPDEQQAQTPDD